MNVQATIWHMLYPIIILLRSIGFRFSIILFIKKTKKLSQPWLKEKSNQTLDRQFSRNTNKLPIFLSKDMVFPLMVTDQLLDLKHTGHKKLKDFFFLSNKFISNSLTFALPLKQRNTIIHESTKHHNWTTIYLIWQTKNNFWNLFDKRL